MPGYRSPVALAALNVAAHMPFTDVVLHAQTLVDLEGRFSFTSHLQAAVGAENLFDELRLVQPPGILQGPRASDDLEA